MSRPNPRHPIFVEAYLSNGFNASAAARAAGYDGGHLDVRGARLLVDPRVRRLIDARLEEMRVAGLPLPKRADRYKNTGYRKTTRVGKVNVLIRARVLERDGFRCRRCGWSVDDGVRLVIDHIVPVARGGSESESNLQTLCVECNAGKRDRDPTEHDLAVTRAANA